MTTNRVQDMLSDVALAKTPYEALPGEVRKAAQARAEAFDRLTKLLHEPETIRVLWGSPPSRNQGRVPAACESDLSELAVTPRDTEVLSALQEHEKDTADEENKAALLTQFDRATVDLVARRETVERALKLLAAKERRS